MIKSNTDVITAYDNCYTCKSNGEVIRLLNKNSN